MKILIIVLLQLFLLADFTIGNNYNGTSKNTTRRFSTRNPLRYDFAASNIKPSNDLVANSVLNLGINIFQHITGASIIISRCVCVR